MAIRQSHGAWPTEPTTIGRLGELEGYLQSVTFKYDWDRRFSHIEIWGLCLNGLRLNYVFEQALYSTW